LGNHAGDDRYSGWRRGRRSGLRQWASVREV
jgi:hypothetical protein